jgi:hypothetical protein
MGGFELNVAPSAEIHPRGNGETCVERMRSDAPGRCDFIKRAVRD